MYIVALGIILLSITGGLLIWIESTDSFIKTMIISILCGILFIIFLSASIYFLSTPDEIITKKENIIVDILDNGKIIINKNIYIKHFEITEKPSYRKIITEKWKNNKNFYFLNTKIKEKYYINRELLEKEGELIFK